MLGIPGLGPKRIKIMNQELGVDSITTLREAAEDDSIAGLKGFGAKSQQRMLDGIELLARFRSRRRLDIGLKYGEAFEQRIAKIPGVQKAQLAGSARRRKDTIGDLDLVVAVEEKDKESVSNAILQLPGIADIKGAGDSKISLILDTSIFDENFSIGHIDPNVLDAIGGDDYELCFTVPESKNLVMGELIESRSVNAVPIGKIIKSNGSGSRVLLNGRACNSKKTGYKHFE